jgi:hypothetical protein
MERLFLDRIDAVATRSPVGRQNDLTAFVRPNETQAALPLAQLAGARTQIALHAALVQSMPVPSCNGVSVT